MTSSTTSDAPLGVMDRLRAETRSAHDATEAIPFSDAMVSERLPRDRYIGQLQAYAIVHAALEAALADADDPAVSAVWRDDLRKSPLLERDLEFFAAEGVVAPPAAIAAAEEHAARLRGLAVADPVALLGHLYVLEGSTLGATVLRRHVARAYGLEGESGLAYYSPYGNDVMTHWKAFRSRVDDAVTDRTAQDSVVAAAKDAFARIGAILSALSDGL